MAGLAGLDQLDQAAAPRCGQPVKAGEFVEVVADLQTAQAACVGVPQAPHLVQRLGDGQFHDLSFSRVWVGDGVAAARRRW
jgi:hypothetical protein